MTRTDYIARTSIGEPVGTFETREQALRWADERGHLFPGWSIVAVEERVIKRVTVLRVDPSQTQQGVAA
jgi:hypothetical protein